MKKIPFTYDEKVSVGNIGWNVEREIPIRHVHFGWNFIEKYEDGSVIENYTSPTNVDPDDGKYDLRETIYKYKTFDDFLQRKIDSKESKIIL